MHPPDLPERVLRHLLEIAIKDQAYAISQAAWYAKTNPYQLKKMPEWLDKKLNETEKHNDNFQPSPRHQAPPLGNQQRARGNPPHVFR